MASFGDPVMALRWVESQAFLPDIVLLGEVFSAFLSAEHASSAAIAYEALRSCHVLSSWNESFILVSFYW